MIIPALLTTNDRIAEERVRLAKEMSGWLHIDMLDNTLYDFASLATEQLAACDFGDLQLELHCMVDDAVKIAQSLLPIARMILHCESPDWEMQYTTLVEKGIDTWLAIDPSTDLRQIELPDDVGGVVLMGVTPGEMGQELLPETFDRLDLIKDYWPDVPVTVDGGVHSDNIGRLIAHGADNLVMGSAIFETPNPVETYQQFVDMSDPLYAVKKTES